MKNICDLYTGNSISENTKQLKYTNLLDGYNYIGTKDVGFDHNVNYSNGVKIPFNESNFRYAYADDILLCIEGGSAGRKISILSEQVCFGNKLCCFHQYLYLSSFLYYFLQSPIFFGLFKDNISGIIGGVSINKIKELIIPLPPLEEQKRIVSKIEELEPFIEEYGKSEEELTKLNKDFPEQIKKSILQYAIQGKLVPQDPNDEPASELLKKISAEKQALIKQGKIKKDKQESYIFKGPDNRHYEKIGTETKDITEEIPFEIPENWCWCRFNTLFNIISSKRVLQSDWKSDGIPFYRAREIAKLADFGTVKNELYISEELFNELSKSYLMPETNDIMVSAVGTIGKPYIVNSYDKFYYKDASVLCYKNFSGINPEYAKIFIESECFVSQYSKDSGGTTVDTLTIIRANQYMISLPPLEEQQRIVLKINELSKYIDKL